MNYNFNNKSFKFFSAKLVTIFLLFNLLFLNTKQSFAEDIKERFRVCDPKGGEGQKGQDVKVEGLDFNPSNGGKDVQFDLDNPVCLTIISTSYALVKSSIAYMNYVCGSGNAVPRVLPSPLLDAVDIAKAASKVGTGPQCASAVAAAIASLGALITEISVVYGIAKDVFDRAHICGYNWRKWNPESMLKDLNGSAQDRGNEWINNPDNESKIAAMKLPGDMAMEFREWYYNGKEYEDNDNSPCLDVSKGKDNNGKYPPQKYYLRGTDTPNFHCEDYNPKKAPEDKYNDYQDAYQCCLKKSQETICIEYNSKTPLLNNNTSIGMTQTDRDNLDRLNDMNGTKSNYKFCKAGSRCTIQGISFSTQYKYNNRLICASTWSLCPYNFNLGGGSTECDYYQDGMNGKPIDPEDVKNSNCAGKSEVRNDDCTYNDKAGKCRNYCQLLENCVVVNSAYNYESSVTSPYFSRACINFVGDSKNDVSYNTGVFSGPQRHFTAPIAQCVKETLENVFYNRAGHSKCLNAFESPDKRELCFSGTYIYKKGDQVANASFFSVLQQKAGLIVKLILTLMITMNGIKILLGNQPLKKNELIMLTVKIGLVIYFVTSDAWQTTYFNGVYRGSDIISQIVMKIKTVGDESRRDGCQFGDVTVQYDANTNMANPVYRFTEPYPENAKYLAIFDTLDCKIARYLGFGPTASASSANILMLIAASFFTWPVGVYFMVLLLIFGFFMIIAALRALHIFLISAMSLIIMVYISIITIPTCLFKKTEGIFKNWLTQLLSFSLQPILLFAYIGMFITIFDFVVLGSATFKGSRPHKSIVCETQCRDNNDNLITMNAQNQQMTDVEGECEGAHGKIFRPKNDSVACIISSNAISKWPGFEIIGISIPILDDLFKSGGRDKILTLIKAALLVYILAQFIDEIPGITSAIIGGKGLPTDKISIQSMAKSATNTISSIQKRIGRGGMKTGKKAYDRTKEVANRIGDKGKDVSKPELTKDEGGKEGGDAAHREE